MKKILIIEPFYGGSHKAMIDELEKGLNFIEYTIIKMTPKKWPWRARCSALYIARELPNIEEYQSLFCSSVLNLSELIGLNPKLANLKKVIYFHENQLIYPIQEIKDRDFQYGYNQIVSCLAADVILFNSEFNKNSFLNNINKFIKLMPDYKQKDLNTLIDHKCDVLYFPVDFTLIDHISINNINDNNKNIDEQIIHIVWPHRWEFDKNPNLFFKTLYRLRENEIKFKISVLGECFSETPECFKEAKEKLNEFINVFGYVNSKEEFYKILSNADIVISTSNHEFFGVSIVESVRAGCIPLLPNNLVYPELYPPECLYCSENELYKKLKIFCRYPNTVKMLKRTLQIDTERFNARNILPKYLEILCEKK